MPRYKQRKTNRALFTADIMKMAVEEVGDKNRPVRAVAKDLGLSRATIARYVRDAHEGRKQGSTVNCKKTHVTKQVGLRRTYVNHCIQCQMRLCL